jgi:hypothetical protein
LGVYDNLLRSKGIEPIKAQEPAEEQAPAIPNKEGYIWLTMLIKYDMNGKAEIVRSFSKHAKDSAIKSLTKPKNFLDKVGSIEAGEVKENLF